MTRKKHPPFSLRKILKILGYIFLFATPLVGLKQFFVYNTSIQRPSLIADENLQITILAEPDNFLSESPKKDLVENILTNLKKQPKITLDQLTKKIFLSSEFENIYLFSNAPDKLFIKVWQRIPILQVKADQLRYVSASGKVYGQADPESKELPVLEGLFNDAKRQYSMTTQNSLLLTDFEQTILQEATLLLQQLQQKKMSLQTIRFEIHRGFFCQLAQPQTLIAIGRAPFDKKITKLEKVINHLATKGTLAEKIELDYAGKVFVKEILK